jgi:hypothetical protein
MAMYLYKEMKRWRNMRGTQIESKSDMRNITALHSKNWSLGFAR